MSARAIFSFLVLAFSAPLLSSASTNSPAVTNLIARESWWSFWDDAAAPSALWKTPAFADAGWRLQPAQFGYGEGDEASRLTPGEAPRITTHYFRRKFHVARAADFTNLLAEVLRDDGVVVYINGQEVFRMNLPAGEINHFTFASVQVMGTNENFYFPTNFSPAALVDGENTIAVELHQLENPSDASFDLSLTAIGPPGTNPRPVLTAERATTVVTLRWQDSDVLLEEMRLPAGIWQTITNALSPYELPAPTDSRLFRLRRR